MSYITRLNKKLIKVFGGQVHGELKDGCLYLSGELSSEADVVRVGKMSVNKKKYNVVNDIKFTGGKIPPVKIPASSNNFPAGARPQVLVIGGGLVGCAIARELTYYKLDVMLLEKEHDVALHSSGRNDGIVHHGLSLRKGKLKKKYTDAGNKLFESVCRELDVPFRRIGQYCTVSQYSIAQPSLCFSGSWMKPAAFLSLLYWKLTGIPAEYISRRKLMEREPNLSDKIKFAIYFPTAGIVNPSALTIAYAENAADNGAKIFLDTVVLDIDVWNEKVVSVMTNHGRIYPKIVINAAGVFAEDIAKLARDRFFSIYQKRSTKMIFDKKAAHLVNSIVSSLYETPAVKPHHSSKAVSCTDGGLITRTIDGNLLVSSNTEEIYEKENFPTDRESIRAALSMQRKTTPNLFERDIITCFTDIHAEAYEEDFIISFGRFTKNIIHAAGIDSRSLAAVPAIAVDVAKMAAEYLHAEVCEKFNPMHKAIIRTAELPIDERDALIKKEPDYGDIVCRCEEISQGEILAALRRSVPCDTIDGVKRRVHAGMGRCQGSGCSLNVTQIIAEEKKTRTNAVITMSDNNAILHGGDKESLC